MTKAERKEWVLPGKKAALFCDAVQYNGLLFTSGLVARNADGSVYCPGDGEAQARFIFENLKNTLALAGAGFRDVIKLTIYLRDMEDRIKINPLREEYFQGTRPASTVVEVSMLAHPDLMVEMEVVAAVTENTGQ